MEEERSRNSTEKISEPKIQKEEKEEIVYKTKLIQFLGRSTPIVLQNDNGPCPLLAICNALLLRNSLNLNGDVSEVSLQKLLSLVAEKLIDSNSNVQDKDAEYVSNQEQNIADAIDLLPRLATGIDVNVQFRKINDFEFTRECAIFDLFDIGLYHGWIVDPQDVETASAIGSKSYNTLVGELVAFEASKSCGQEDKNIVEGDSVDFAAATTAALGVPSPCLSRNISFEQTGSGKGDIEETEELMRTLNLSKVEMSISSDVNSSYILEESGEVVNHHDSSATQIGTLGSDESQQYDLITPQQINTASIDFKDDGLNSNVSSIENDVLLSSNTNTASEKDHTVSEGSENLAISNGSLDVLSDPQSFAEDIFGSQIPNMIANNATKDDDSEIFTIQPIIQYANIHPSNGRQELQDMSEVGTSCLDNSEPIYEGEECMLDSGLPKYEDREPVYEGEMVLAQQAENVREDDACVNFREQDGLRRCHLIRNFLENSASQLTIYGLFCLQEGLKERELCVFFRNNHFNTMFKFNGELYLLATDQGYINQSDLVWEKLNEVNGDTVFMTGNFTEFKIDNQVSDSWNEQNAMTSTADYLATLEASAPAGSSVNSDFQLAIALQQQEFEQQPQQQQQKQQHHHNTQRSQQQSASSGRSKLITGPQVSRNSHASQKNEAKKDKCNIM